MFGLFNYQIKWDNIEYDIETLDVEGITVVIEERNDVESSFILKKFFLVVYFPAFKDWGITAYQKVFWQDFLMPFDGPVWMYFENFTCSMTFQFELDKYKAYLYPNIDSMDI